MEYDFIKEPKTGDLILVSCGNNMSPAFYVESERGNYYWEWWNITRAYEKYKETGKFKPKVSYFNSDWESRMVRFNINELNPNYYRYKGIMEAIEILREMKIINY